MLNLVTQHAGQWLFLANSGTALTTGFQGGSAFALEGCAFIDAPILAGFDAATDKTTIDFQLQVSDDAVNGPWLPLESNDITLATGATTPTATHSLAAAAGSTVYGRLQTTRPIQAKYVRIAAKYTGGTAPKAGDSATSSLNYDAN
jgi:hypothetical protein